MNSDDRNPQNSSPTPLPPRGTDPDHRHQPDADRPPAAHPGGESAPVLYTPAQAAERLMVRESWLRRRAAQRLVPCTFLGKHLRFSPTDLERIIADAARPARPPTTRRPARRR